jgi:hypothetical protein
MLWGNAIFSVGSIIIAAASTVRSFKFMIFGTVVESLGDIATQVAQYKVFSSWFPPSSGFASTLGLELGIGKVRVNSASVCYVPLIGACRLDPF